MIKKCIWNNSKKYICNNLNNNIETDILIIGSGIVGITTTYFLKDKKLNIALVEKNKISDSSGFKSSGLISYFHNYFLDILDEEKIKKYLTSQNEATEIIKDIIIDNNIKCDFESNNSYIVFKKKDDLFKFSEILNKLKIRHTILKKTPTRNDGLCLKLTDSATINPSKYLMELFNVINTYKNINIYENTMITKIIKKDNYYYSYTNNNCIKSKKIVITSKDLIINIDKDLSNYIYTLKNKLFFYESNNNRRFNIINTYNNSILRSCFDNKKHYYITSFYNENNLFSNNTIYYWNTYINLSKDYFPIVGIINNGFIISSGNGLYDITNGTISAKIISDMILNIDNKFSSLFSPNRFLKND